MPVTKQSKQWMHSSVRKPLPAELPLVHCCTLLYCPLQVIDAVGLSDIPFNIPPSALSGGQQRRLALALQLVRAPSLMLLDEPLAGLDWHARRYEHGSCVVCFAA